MGSYGATSYNRDGELIGTSPVNGYQDSTQGDGFGLGYDTQYCYTVEGVNEYGTAGSASNDACLQLFLLTGILASKYKSCKCGCSSSGKPIW